MTEPADVQPEQWDMYAHQLDDRGYLHICATERRTRLYSARMPVIPVTVTLDPNGPYTGWIVTGTTTPIQILRHHLFDVQFVYGHKNEEDRGKGTAVPLTITARTPRAIS